MSILLLFEITATSHIFVLHSLEVPPDQIPHMSLYVYTFVRSYLNVHFTSKLKNSHITMEMF